MYFGMGKSFFCQSAGLKNYFLYVSRLPAYKLNMGRGEWEREGKYQAYLFLEFECLHSKIWM